MLTVHHGGILPSSEDTLPDANLVTLPQLPFGYMFEDLQKEENLLPETCTTISSLRYLGSEGMRDRADKIPGIPVPAIHTFLGQFIDHDITLMDDRGAQISLANPTPLTRDQIKKVVNARSPNLDLDNVYGPDFDGNLSPRDPDDPKRKMKIGKVEPDDGLPDGVIGELHDLPRLENGIAQIGDPRDDENLIIAQLHVAFLRAHNFIVDDYDVGFDDARKILIQHYQCIVLDFLEQVCAPGIVKRIIDEGPKFFPPADKPFFMPLEFSIAAYRFGHSKVRASYDDFNSKQGPGTFDFLFGLTRQRLPDNWVISWPSFLDPKNKGRFSRPIDTTLSGPLLSLGEKQLNGHDPNVGNLAVRNLLRGYMFRMPTGQAVANAMAAKGIQGIEPMTSKEIESVAKQRPISDSKTQADFLSPNFLEKTPLWFYILAEAALGGGVHLGPVGSTIVAEVLIGVLRNSTYSILTDPGWKGPTLKQATPGKFDIADLLRLARVI